MSVSYRTLATTALAGLTGVAFSTKKKEKKILFLQKQYDWWLVEETK